MRKLLIFLFLAGFIITSVNLVFTQQNQKQESQPIERIDKKIDNNAELETSKEVKKDLREEYLRDTNRIEQHFYKFLAIGIVGLLILTLIGINLILPLIKTAIRKITLEEINGVLSKQELEDLISKGKTQIVEFEKNNAKYNEILSELQKEKINTNMSLSEEENANLAEYTKVVKLDPKLAGLYLNFIESHITNNKYRDALKIVENIKKLELDIRDMAVILHFECIASKMLNKDTSQCDKKYDESLKEDFDLHDWDFEPIDNWLNKENIYEDKKMYIEDVIAKLKLHKK